MGLLVGNENAYGSSMVFVVGSVENARRPGLAFVVMEMLMDVRGLLVAKMLIDLARPLR